MWLFGCKLYGHDEEDLNFIQVTSKESIGIEISKAAINKEWDKQGIYRQFKSIGKQLFEYRYV